MILCLISLSSSVNIYIKLWKYNISVYLQIKELLLATAPAYSCFLTINFHILNVFRLLQLPYLGCLYLYVIIDLHTLPATLLYRLLFLWQILSNSGPVYNISISHNKLAHYVALT
jgi:hypothetical protein